MSSIKVKPVTLFLTSKLSAVRGPTRMPCRICSTATGLPPVGAHRLARESRRAAVGIHCTGRRRLRRGSVIRVRVRCRPDDVEALRVMCLGTAVRCAVGVDDEVIGLYTRGGDTARHGSRARLLVEAHEVLVAILGV